MNLRMRQRQPGGAGVIKGRQGGMGNHPGAIISNHCDFCNCYGQKSYGWWYSNKVPVRARLKASRYAYRAGFGDSEGLGAPRAPRRRYFFARRFSMAGGAGRPSGLPVLIPVRQPRITRHPNRLATVSGGPAILIRTIAMNHQAKGEIRPNSTPTRPQATALVRDCGFLAGELNRLADDAERLSIVCPGDDRIVDIAKWADDAYSLIRSAYRAACSLQVSASAAEAGSQGGEQ